MTTRPKSDLSPPESAAAGGRDENLVDGKPHGLWGVGVLRGGELRRCIGIDLTETVIHPGAEALRYE